MSKILKYPDETKRLPKGAIIICPTCKRDNFRFKETIGEQTFPTHTLIENVQTGEEPGAIDKFACLTCGASLFRDGMPGLLLVKLE